jgi:hypothetical protein
MQRFAGSPVSSRLWLTSDLHVSGFPKLQYPYHPLQVSVVDSTLLFSFSAFFQFSTPQLEWIDRKITMVRNFFFVDLPYVREMHVQRDCLRYFLRQILLCVSSTQSMSLTSYNVVFATRFSFSLFERRICTNSVARTKPKLFAYDSVFYGGMRWVDMVFMQLVHGKFTTVYLCLSLVWLGGRAEKAPGGGKR